MKVYNLKIILLVIALYAITLVIILKSLNSRQSLLNTPSDHGNVVVNVWSKAAIGEYLWEHILGGHTKLSQDGLKSFGELTEGDIKFKYETGPGLIRNSVSVGVENLVLVLNGRTNEKINSGIGWLKLAQNLPHLKTLFVVMLGREDCNNTWILPFLKINGGSIEVLFLTYDSPIVDNINVIQWPLGVATYRHFPQVKDDGITIKTDRKYLCNFLGTVYKNSSRELLLRAVSGTWEKLCYIRGRQRWEPKETVKSMSDYVNVISQSDLTLCPVGINAECYRMYEAMALGSVPVVEMKAGISPGLCNNKQGPLRLMKKFHAPIIALYDWNYLPMILNDFQQLSAKEKAMRRTTVSNWYIWFCNKLKKQFVELITTKVFVDIASSNEQV